MSIRRYRQVTIKPQKATVTDNLILKIEETLTIIMMGVLEGKMDEFNEKEKKTINFYNFMQEEKLKWINDEKSTVDLINEAKTTRVHIWESCQKIPFSQLLYIAEIKPGRSTRDVLLKKNLQAAYLIVSTWVDTVLQEHYRLPKARREFLFEHIVDWIDSYQKGYLNNELIKELFIEDLNYDIERGERIS